MVFDNTQRWMLLMKMDNSWKAGAALDIGCIVSEISSKFMRFVPDN